MFIKQAAGLFLSRVCLTIFILSGALQVASAVQAGQVNLPESGIRLAIPSSVVTVDTTSNIVDGDTTSISALLAHKGSDNHISFSEALAAVNATGTGNTINFSLAHGSVITAPVTWILSAPNTTIDGGAPDVIMTAPAGKIWLEIRSAGNTIKNLAFAGLGIDTIDAHDNLVTGSFIGTDIAGLASFGVESNGVEIFAGAHHNIIEKNTIAGLHATSVMTDAVGVRIYSGAHDNTVRGNIFGINNAGVSLSNDDGVFIYSGAYSNTIGGLRTSSTCDGPCNVISNSTHNGVAVQDSGTISNVVSGNYIGLNQAGTQAMGNSLPAIVIIAGAAQNTIGGMRSTSACDGPCNVISGNPGNAVSLKDSGTISNVVQGNYIGVNPSGTAAIPNGTQDWVAVVVANGASQNTIGGLRSTSVCDGPCNVISGNAQRAVAVTGAGANYNVVAGNYIGVNPTGASPMPNNVVFGSSALAVTNGAWQTLIGGVRPTNACAGPCNVISGNLQRGVVITGSNTYSTVVQGNFIGVNPFGTAALGNSASGVSIIEGASLNLIGGLRASTVCDGPCNVISGNGQNGVAITGTGVLWNQVAGNYIGSDPFGVIAMSNGAAGVLLGDHANANTVGGSRAETACDGPCNVISGNAQQGISITAATNNIVAGNYIGVRPDGGVAMGNGASGMSVVDGAIGNVIGGVERYSPACTRTCNVISGNGQQGVLIAGAATVNVALLGNYIGVNPTGTMTMSNGLTPDFPGVDIASGASNNFIGATIVNSVACLECGNVVSGNTGGGIRLQGAGTNNNQVQANEIGVRVLPTGQAVAMGNGTYGVAIMNGAAQNLIGGDSTAGCGGNCSNSNVISGNQQQGVLISGTGTISNFVQGNHIGIGLTYGGANLTVPNSVQPGYPAVDIAGGASQNVIGGTRAASYCSDVCNTISGNGDAGVRLRDAGTSDNIVQGNQIGIVGLNPAGNGGSGVVVVAGASRNLIGGIRTGSACDGQCNVISANQGHGVLLTGTTTLSNAVLGNYIGPSADDLLAMGNGASGIAMTDGAAQNIIGGARTSTACDGPCNVVSGNQQNGVLISGTGTISNLVQGNTIGLDAYGLFTVPNALSGVFIAAGASHNIVGGDRSPGDCVGRCNYINGNGRAGVTVLGASSRGNTIRGNNIHDNGRLGIDLADDGVTRNGNGAAAVGPNDFMSFPSSVVAAYDGVNTTLTGVVSTTYPLTTTIDLYASNIIDPSGYGEGRYYLGAATPDASGRYTLTVLGRMFYPFASATATDGNGSTSEFSLVDTDGDSLPDLWELQGVTIGGVFIDLREMGADPMHRDLFVHADWMDKPGLKPRDADIKTVIDAFGIAPMLNPDGSNGVHLHVDLGQFSIMDPVKGTTWGALSAAGPQPYAATIGQTANNVYNWSAVDALKTVYFNPAQRQFIFHYMCFCSNLGGLGTVSGIARGIPGTDFLVTLDGWQTSGGTSLQKSGTFMHELGHTLGLRHGGDDNVNDKPNYLSIMNYLFQTVGLLTQGTNQVDFDYSRRKLTDLNETALSESAGIGDPDNHHTFWGPLTGACAANPNTYFKQLIYPAIDWTCNGALTPGTVAVDVTNDICVSSGSDGILTTVPLSDDVKIGLNIYDGPNRTCNTAAGVGDKQIRAVGSAQLNQLSGHNDWAAVRFDGGGQLGATVSTTVLLLHPAAAQAVTTTVDEDNSQEYLRSIVPPDIFNAEQYAPVDVVTASAHYGVAPLSVQFDGTASYALSGTIAAYTWEYGDGARGAGALTSHVYSATGTYYASLTITDTTGHVNLVPKLQWITVVSESVVFVDAHAGGSTHNGSSWGTAFTSLQDGIDAAGPGGEVWVAQGVYKPVNGTVFVSPTFLLKSGVAVYGGFAATETQRSQRDWVTHITVLSGDLDGNDATNANGIVTIWTGISGVNAWHVVTVKDQVTNARLDGFTITSGSANPINGAPADLNGGGMYVAANTSIWLENLIFSGNRATNDGGGMFEGLTNTTTLSNVTFTGNWASLSTGGGLCTGSNDNLINVTFTGNRALTGSGMSTCNQSPSPKLNHVTFRSNLGPAMYNSGAGSTTLSDVAFISNTGSYFGGGLENHQITPTLIRVTFQGNTAPLGAGMYSSGQYNAYSTPLLINVTFKDNTAGAGGGMYNDYSNARLINSTFSGNRATNTSDGGGGLYNYVSNPALNNVLFISNSTVYRGGGIFDFVSHPTLVNVTMSGNSAFTNTSISSGLGGGIYNEINSTAVVANSILWGDAARSSGAEVYNDAGSMVTITYSDLQWPGGIYTGTGNINANPLFINPITPTIPLSFTPNYRLQGVSPAINAGNNLSVTIFTDLDGRARIMGLRVDMGAYERLEVAPFQVYMPLTTH